MIFALTGSALADKHGHGKHDGDDDDDQGKHYYSEHDRDEMRGWYYEHGDRLPPGLAKRDQLPPGLEKQLRVRGRYVDLDRLRSTNGQQEKAFNQQCDNRHPILQGLLLKSF